MRKGFGLYSSHETTIFLLKAILLSFWAGVDLLALMAVSTLPFSALVEHRFLVVLVLAILIAGTVFSVLFAWTTGTLFGRNTVRTRTGPFERACDALKSRPYWLVGAGVLLTLALVLVATRGLVGLQEDKEASLQLTGANAITAKKCSEIARLERWLFQAEENVVIAQCLVQYDQAYTGLRRVAMQQKR